MSFGSELKDFVAGFKVGADALKPTRAELAAKAKRDEEKGLKAAQAEELANAGRNKTVQTRASTGTPGGDEEDVARTLVAEAGSEGDEGMAAAAHVINNRATLSGKSWGDVVRAPGQFEAYGNGQFKNVAPEQLEKAKQILAGVRDGTLKDPTGGATHYYNPELNAKLARERGDRRAKPAWDDGTGTRIGRHVFFKRPGDFRRTMEAGETPRRQAALPARAAYSSLPADEVEGDEEETQSFAEGGLVEEQSRQQALDLGQSESGGSGGAGALANAEGHAGASMDPRSFVNPEGVAEAVDAGMRRINQTYGLGGAIASADPQSRTKIEAFTRNVGAPPPQEVRAAQQTVDPRGELSPDERTMATLYAGYKFYVGRGEPQRAANYAASMLMHAKRVVQTSGAFATAALEQGDVEGAAKAIAAGYSQVPDGKTVKMLGADRDGVAFGVYDAQGNLTSKGKARIDDLMRVATGMVDGTQWFEQMGLFARPPGDKPLTPAQERQQALRTRELDLRERSLSRQEQREQRLAAGRQPAGTTPAGTQRQPGAIKLTAKEREAQREQDELATARQGLDQAQVSRDDDVDPAGAESRRVQAGANYADTAFRQATKGTTVDTGQDAVNAVDEQIAKRFGGKEPPETVKFAYRNSIQKIMQGNDIAADQAALVVFEATKPGAKVVVGNDGTIRVGASPPIKVDRQTLMQLAQIRSAAEAKRQPAATAASPGAKSAIVAPQPDRSRELMERRRQQSDRPSVAEEQIKALANTPW